MTGSQSINAPSFIRSTFHVIRAVLLILVPAISAFQANKKLPDFEKTLKAASDLIRQGEFRKSEAEFQSILVKAEKVQNEYYVARAHIGLAASQMMTQNYTDAVRNAETALRYGFAKDPDVAVRAGLNLSSVYRRMKDFAAAAQSLRDLNPLIPQLTDGQAKTQLYIHAATNFSRSGNWARAEPLFYAGIDSALSQGDVQTAASAWNQLGYMRLQHNDLVHAEAALTEAFRLRRLSGNRNLTASYTYLAMLRLTQGDPVSAKNLLNSAIGLIATTDSGIPAYVLYYWRAKAEAASGEVRAALADFEDAVNLVKRWRQEVLPTDGFRITAEVGLDLVYDDYVQTGMRAWETTKDQALARRMFEVSEEHRSASFREMQRSAKPPPPDYWEALAQYRTVLASSFASSANALAVDQARVRLALIEATLGIKTEDETPVKVATTQKSLAKSEALISFHTSEDRSYIWGITQNGFVSHIAPGRRELAPAAKRFREAVEKNTPFADANTTLYAMLFGNLSSEIQAKPDWLLSLDRGLFDAPLAALGPEDNPLILSHSLRTVPGAAMLHRIGFVSQKRGFVGAGDAIYNSADPRWKGQRNNGPSQFARLVSTNREVKQVAKAWPMDQKPTLLFGESFSRAALGRAFQAEPAIVHIAAHVVQGRNNAANVMIAVGLAADGKADFLTPADIAAQASRLGLVSINGCASGGGAVLPGAGLIGLSRAWLIGGATAVAATYWPIEDAGGELFSSMYRELLRAGGPPITALKAARALQSAQIAAFRSKGHQSTRNVWASVFLAGKR